MRRIVPVAALAALAGCFTPTWQRHLAGTALPDDKVILVGSFTTVPPIQQRGNSTDRGGWVNGRYEGPTNVVFVGETKGNAAAIFTPDLSEPWQQNARSVGFSTYDWAWFPMDGGAYVVEVPRRPRLNLRGVIYLTDGGWVRFEVPAQVDLRPDDRVVYVGEIRVVRSGDRRTLFNDRTAETRNALKAAGYAEALAVPWRTSVFRPLEAAR